MARFPQRPARLTHGYDNLSVWQAGGQATFAGLTLGANIKGGQVEDGYTFKPKGGRDALAYIIGASYVIQQYVIGAPATSTRKAPVPISQVPRASPTP